MPEPAQRSLNPSQMHVLLSALSIIGRILEGPAGEGAGDLRAGLERRTGRACLGLLLLLGPDAWEGEQDLEAYSWNES